MFSNVTTIMGQISYFYTHKRLTVIMENSMVVNQDQKKPPKNLNTIHLMCFLLHHRKRTEKEANWVNGRQDIFFTLLHKP